MHSSDRRTNSAKRFLKLSPLFEVDDCEIDVPQEGVSEVVLVSAVFDTVVGGAGV